MTALEPMTRPGHARPHLSDLLTASESLILPGAYDAFSAKIIEESGFPAVYIGSYGTAASAFGMPDVGALTLDQLAQHASSVSESVTVPVIADAEGGFFDAPNIWRTVRAFERAGVQAIHIEDHAGGKHTTLPQTLVPLPVMLQRLRAALDARQNGDFVIIARTDAIWAAQNEEEAWRRIRAFAEIGIKYFFPNGASPDLLRRMRNEFPEATFITINLPTVVDRSEWNGAADIVIDYGFCLQVVARSLTEALKRYRLSSLADHTSGFIEQASRLEERMGYQEFTTRAMKYTNLEIPTLMK